jgi:hypothetical protein
MCENIEQLKRDLELEKRVDAALEVRERQQAQYKQNLAQMMALNQSIMEKKKQALLADKLAEQQAYIEELEAQSLKVNR